MTTILTVMLERTHYRRWVRGEHEPFGETRPSVTAYSQWKDPLMSPSITCQNSSWNRNLYRL
jgi:hypothetical protein